MKKRKNVWEMAGILYPMISALMLIWLAKFIPVNVQEPETLTGESHQLARVSHREILPVKDGVSSIHSEFVRMEPESGDTDEVHTINRADGKSRDGDLLFVETSAHALTIKSGVGNIILDGRSDATITNLYEAIRFIFIDGYWVQL